MDEWTYYKRWLFIESVFNSYVIVILINNKPVKGTGNRKITQHHLCSEKRITQIKRKDKWRAWCAMDQWEGEPKGKVYCQGLNKKVTSTHDPKKMLLAARLVVETEEGEVGPQRCAREGAQVAQNNTVKENPGEATTLGKYEPEHWRPRRKSPPGAWHLI